MANLSVLCKVLVLFFILKENIIKSLILPDILICSEHGSHLTNCSSRNDTPSCKEINNILCPMGALDSYAYPFSNFGYVVCWHHKTFCEFCSYDAVYISYLYSGKCIPVDRPQIRSKKNLYLHNCPFYNRRKDLYPYEARKYSYLQCSGGTLTVLKCGLGQMFSIQKRCCLPVYVPGPAPPNVARNHSNVPVVLYNDTISCPLSLFGVFPHPFSNEKYLKCVEGYLYDKSCGRGFVYNFMSKFCVEKTNNLFRILPPVQNNYIGESVIETQISDNLTFLKCPKGLVGKFVHPFNCFNYIYCSAAGTQIKSCERREVYSFRVNKCVIQSRLDQYDHVPCFESNEEKGEDSSSLGVFCSRTGYMNYPHPRSQYRYVNCNNGVLQVKRCPRNEIFSLDDLNCVDEPTDLDEENDYE